MSDYLARYWHKLPTGKIQCDLCPRECKLKPGQRGLCFVRQNVAGQLILTTYGKSSGFCIDPVEKKPLNHFYPGSPVLSFGTAGCNLACKFCQNWDIARSKEFDRLTETASPKAIATAAARHGCKSVALTYNEPVIFLEYGEDVSEESHQKQVQVIAVTNGYIKGQAREDFFTYVDAANVDLKGFSERFYKTLTGGDLKTVLDTLVYIRQKTRVWLEITTLLIPGENDSDSEIRALSKWVVNELGVDTPVHFSAFHPDFNYRDAPPTPLKTIVRARELAMETGLIYVYTGNVRFTPGDTTYCPTCRKELIVRDWYEIRQHAINQNGQCDFCHTPIAGRFDRKPGNWGAKRQPVRI